MSALPQPHEGITGADRRNDGLLSLEDTAVAARRVMMLLAWELNMATLRFPLTDMGERVREPRVGDLVVETSKGIVSLRADRELEHRAFGYLVAQRDEWPETNDEYEAYLVQNPSMRDQERWHEDAWYVQYGPDPSDVCRWSNCSFIAVPTDLGFARVGES